MGAIVDKAWKALIDQISRDKCISIDQAEDIMQECLYQLIDFWNGLRNYDSDADILDDYLSLSADYMWVFEQQAGM